jgi:hypothetical protein
MVLISGYAAVFIITAAASAPTEEAKIGTNFTSGGNNNFGHFLLLALILGWDLRKSVSICVHDRAGPQSIGTAVVLVIHGDLSAGAKEFTIQCARVYTFVRFKKHKY